eukprot:gnl/TRDRNA2_/TRDRNA2_154068_c0_seq1.p1 gnl/TRDRNA2_/TRDRNA2_154068_c0~~gnl/TRDRNA2_/TRDRNA2_154068_c0_seq1.p1  ORF type:complete len:412 (+),score=51.00 gnl/TRDRNA2_/TRDRNA2_154068_c0_seq1:53-1288(+)
MTEQLLPEETVWWLCVVWTVAWSMLHCLCHWAPAPTVTCCGPLGSGPLNEMRPLGPWRRRWRRLARQQVYNLLAVCGGAVLAVRYRSAEMLDGYFTKSHQVLFAPAVGHWLVAAVEDMMCDPDEWDIFMVVRPLYLLHHIGAAGIFAFCLSTKRMSVIGVGGLLFESPVLLLNMLHGMKARKVLDSLSVRRLYALWALTWVVALLVRGGLLLFYGASLVWWQERWADVPLEGWWHLGFAFFAAISCGWCCLLVPLWAFEDISKQEILSAGLIPPNAQSATGSPLEIHAPEMKVAGSLVPAASDHTSGVLGHVQDGGAECEPGAAAAGCTCREAPDEHSVSLAVDDSTLRQAAQEPAPAAHSPDTAPRACSSGPRMTIDRNPSQQSPQTFRQQKNNPGSPLAPPSDSKQVSL